MIYLSLFALSSETENIKLDEVSKSLLNILIDILFMMGKNEVLSNISGSCSTVLNFLTEIINVTSPDTVCIGGVPLYFCPASKWVSRRQ
jgi:hypothetical protein